MHIHVGMCGLHMMCYYWKSQFLFLVESDGIVEAKSPSPCISIDLLKEIASGMVRVVKMSSVV